MILLIIVGLLMIAINPIIGCLYIGGMFTIIAVGIINKEEKKKGKK